jgi:hypothetical protein
MIPGQARTIACISFSYVTKIIAVAVIILALGETVNAIDLWIEARK